MDVEYQEQATHKASTIDTISTLDSGKNSEMGTMYIMLLKAMLS